MTYTIIGGDGKQYGPVSGDDLRKWISEGRVNGQTMVKSETDPDFHPLSTFPEFADVFGQRTAASSPTVLTPFADTSREHADSAVKAPAIALIVTAAVEIFFGIIGLIRYNATMQMYANMPQFNDPQMQQILHSVSGPVGIFTNLFQILMAAVVLVAAIRMLALKNYAFAFTGAVLAVIPCVTPCCGLLTL